MKEQKRGEVESRPYTVTRQYCRDVLLTVTAILLPASLALSQNLPGESNPNEQSPLRLSTHSSSTLSGRLVPKLLGGNFENLQLRPIALIQMSFGSCTGTLVGKKTVLTAAHCLEGSERTEDYTVRLAGQSYGITNGSYPANYQPEVVSMRNSRFDIAVLTLDREVTNMSPYPILLSDPPAKKERGTMYGYGLNEAPPPSDLITNGKSAAAVINSVPDGVISTSLTSSQGAVCSGDSGGPLTQTINNQIVVIGVTSTGSSVDEGTICKPNGATVSNFVNLQSKYALTFLREFDDVQYISGKTLRAMPIAKNAKARLSSIEQLSSLGKIRSTLSTVTSLLGQMRPLLSKRDLGVLKKVQSNVSKARGAKSVADAKKLSAAAARALDTLSFKFE